MTNKYKLAPSVPTDKMIENAIESYNENGKFTLSTHYTAMLKDAPTLAEVDLDKTYAEYLNTIDYEVVSFSQFIEQKHGKLYAVVKND